MTEKSDKNNNSNAKSNEKNISKTLRNRIVGFLVLLSLILIFIPFLMKDEVQTRKNADAIAITPNGAVTDNNGQLVAADEHDYSDLLAPVDDSEKTTANNPKGTSPFDALKTNRNDSQTAEVTEDTYLANQNQLEVATPTSEVPTAIPSANKQTTEVLRSTHKAVTPNPKVQVQPSHNTGSSSNNTLTSGNYAAQVGVFSRKSGAQKIIGQLKKAGFTAITQNVNINGKPLIKVYAGTSKNRSEVSGICQKVTAKTGIKCMIQTL